MTDWLTGRGEMYALGLIVAAALLGWAYLRLRRRGSRAAPREATTQHVSTVRQLRIELDQVNSEVSRIPETYARADELARVRGQVEGLKQQVAALTYAAPPVVFPRPDPVGFDGGYPNPIDLPSTYDAVERVAVGPPSGSARAAASYLEGGIPVEVRDERIVRSSSLPPTAFLIVQGGGQAEVWLNPDVGLNEFATDKWAVYFDLRGGRPHAAYDTNEPAVVGWSGDAGSTEVVRRGVAVAR